MTARPLLPKSRTLETGDFLGPRGQAAIMAAAACFDWCPEPGRHKFTIRLQRYAREASSRR